MSEYRRRCAVVTFCLLTLVSAGTAIAQQRPLVTEDPETIGAGRVLVEGGLDYGRDMFFSASGLEGHLLRAPLIGVSVGISSIAEIQLDGGAYNRLSITHRRAAPLAELLDVVGTRTSDVEDMVIATKIRVASETTRRPAFGLRFATKLPNASNESGLGLDTTDFFVSLLGGKTVRSIRIVGNFGLGILADPTRGDRQNDVITFGGSIARAVAPDLEIVGEMNGRADVRRGVPPVGTESRAVVRIGTRLTGGAGRVDAGLLLGITARDPSFGFTAGYTYVFNAFTIP